MQNVPQLPFPSNGTAAVGYTTDPTPEDPYLYQTGFGNRFVSEAIEGVVPISQNTPQRVKYDLYSEQLNASAVVSHNKDTRHVWLYRVRPSVAHASLELSTNINTNFESCFLSTNAAVETCISQQAWDPFPLLEVHSSTTGVESVNFVRGIRTVAGKGDSSLEQGLAIHIYSANANMDREAFCNNEGEMLILPQHGRLDIRTELGCLMVKPGEVVLMPTGVRFSVELPDGPSRGYIQEVFGTRHQLPERGVLGPNSLALDRHFHIPVASYLIDENPWNIIYKTGGCLYSSQQNHSPFDVIAWHGNHVPVKYNLRDFTNLVNSNKDQADPTLYCVFTVPRRRTEGPLSEFCIFTEKWLTATGTFRPPYYHRNMSSEIMGLVFGQYGGSSHVLAPGGLSYEAAFMPHGETYETWRDASTRDLEPVQVCTDTMAFMFHIGGAMKLTKWALNGEGAKSLHPSSATQWDSIRPHFFDHADDINADIAAAELKRTKLESGQL